MSDLLAFTRFPFLAGPDLRGVPPLPCTWAGASDPRRVLRSLVHLAGCFGPKSPLAHVHSFSQRRQQCAQIVLFAFLVVAQEGVRETGWMTLGSGAEAVLSPQLLTAMGLTSRAATAQRQPRRVHSVGVRTRSVCAFPPLWVFA